MSVLVLTALQAKALEVLIGTAIDALMRYEQVKDFNDDQCQIIIDEGLKKKDELDKRLAGHYE